MADPTLSDIDFKNEMGLVWTILNYFSKKLFATKSILIDHVFLETVYPKTISIFEDSTAF